MTERVPTHRCKVCGCKWILWPAGAFGEESSWSLGTNEKCGQCCDNAPMDYQIETLAYAYDHMRSVLLNAVEIIQVWHNMGAGKDASELWDIYWRNAPEMKPIRAALSVNGSGEP